MPAIFIDANAPLYASGKPDPLKRPSAEIIGFIVSHAEVFVTSAEVLQEVLHYCRVRRTWDESAESFYAFADLMRGHVESVHAADVEDAATISRQYPRLSARDLIHLAVMRRLGVSRIVSADRGFDAVDEVERLDPARFDEWRDSVSP